jgi:hypothetical protein
VRLTATLKRSLLQPTGPRRRVRSWLIWAASSALAFILMRGPWAGAQIAVLRGLGAEGGSSS